MPRLESFTSSGFPYIFHGIPPPNLTSLRLIGYGSPDIRIDVEDIPDRIQHLYLTHFSLNTRHDGISSRRQLSDLRLIELSEVRFLGTSSKCIVAENLEDLQLRGGSWPTRTNILGHIDDLFVNHSLFGSRLLRNLTLLGMSIDAAAIPSIQAHHHLQKLTILDCTISMLFLEQFHTLASEEMLCPQLELLYIDWTATHEELLEFERLCGIYRPSLTVKLT